MIGRLFHSIVTQFNNNQLQTIECVTGLMFPTELRTDS